MPGLRAKRMKELRIDEASGVDAPAHRSPGWMVLKAAGDPLAELSDEQIEAAIKALGADEQGEPVEELIASLTKALGTMPAAAQAQATALIGALGGDAGGDDLVAKAVADAITKANTEREAAETRAKAAEDALAKARAGVLGTGSQETEEESLAKAMETWPEPVRKAWADQQAKVTKAEADAEEAAKVAKEERDARVSTEYLAKAKGPEYSGLAKAETLATVLREVDEKLSKEAGAELHRLLKAASHLANGGAGDFVVYGGEGAEVSSAAGAQSQIEKAAAEILTAEPTLTRSQAMVKAADAHPDLARVAAPQGGQD